MTIRQPTLGSRSKRIIEHDGLLPYLKARQDAEEVK